MPRDFSAIKNNEEMADVLTGSRIEKAEILEGPGKMPALVLEIETIAGETLRFRTFPNANMQTQMQGTQALVSAALGLRFTLEVPKE